MNLKKLLPKLIIVLLSLLIVYLGAFLFVLVKSRPEGKVATCSAQESSDPIIVHKGCEAGEQANIKEVQALFERMPGELRAGKGDSIAGGDHIDAATLKKLLPARAKITVLPSTWQRTGAIADVNIRTAQLGLFPKVTNWRAIVARGDDKTWKLESTMAEVDAAQIQSGTYSNTGSN